MPAVAVYSHRFLDEAGFTGSAAFLVPAGFVAVVRDLDCWVGAGAGGSIEMGIGGSAVFFGYTFSVVTVQATATWRGRQVLNSGEQLLVATDAPADFAVSGYLLSLP